MGDVVARDFSPEDKVAFAAALEEKRRSPGVSTERMLLPLAEHAGLSELAVRWETELLRANLRVDTIGRLSRLEQLQTDRLRFAELAQELESVAEMNVSQTYRIRVDAAGAYRKAGNPAAELRVLEPVPLALLDARAPPATSMLPEREPAWPIARPHGVAALMQMVASYGRPRHR